MVDTRKTISLLNTNQAHKNSAEASHNRHVISFTLHSTRNVSFVFDTVYLEACTVWFIIVVHVFQSALNFK